MSSDMEAKELVEALQERLQEECIEAEDPFDVYVNRLKSSVYSRPDQADRLGRGYDALLQAITQSKLDR